jgi:hypothetical protein
VDVPGAQAGRDGGDDVAPAGRAAVVPALGGVGPAHRLEVQAHAQLLGRKQQLLQHVAGGRQVDQQAQRQLPLHDHLLDVCQGGAAIDQDGAQGGGHAGAVGAGDGDQNAIARGGLGLGRAHGRSVYRLPVRSAPHSTGRRAPTAR